MLEKKLIIFDWDGTLLDSGAQITRCMQLTADAHKLNRPTKAAVEDVIGLSLEHSIARLFPSLSQPQVTAMAITYREYYLFKDKTPSPLYPHAHQLLQSLNAAGYALAVATGKSRRGLNKNFEDTQSAAFFPISRCADETRSKPDPTMVNEILVDYNCRPEEAVMVGDTSYDMQTAVNAGIDRIAVLHGSHDSDTLSPYSPLALCKDLYALQQFILQSECGH